MKIVAQKLNYDMSVPAETPVENNTPAAAQGQTAATSGQSTPPQSPSVAPNTPPKYKSSSIAIKLSYNQPQSSQDKPSEPESGKQFSQVLSVPNPLERATPLTHSRSASSLAEVKKLNLPVTAGTCFMFVIFVYSHWARPGSRRDLDCDQNSMNACSARTIRMHSRVSAVTTTKLIFAWTRLSSYPMSKVIPLLQPRVLSH